MKLLISAILSLFFISSVEILIYEKSFCYTDSNKRNRWGCYFISDRFLVGKRESPFKATVLYNVAVPKDKISVGRKIAGSRYRIKK